MQSPPCIACGNMVDPSGHTVLTLRTILTGMAQTDVLDRLSVLPQRVVLVVCSTCWPALRDATEREGVAA